MRTSLFIFFIFLINLCSSAQENKPYFQQQVNYNIDVRLDDISNQLDASETIKYTNNSPDKLDFIYFHLWPNGYKNYKSALCKQKLEEGNTDLYYAEDYKLGFIDGLNFTSKGSNLQWEYTLENEDICRVFLPETLLPGESIEISTPFSVKIPLGTISRLGHIGQSYQITQWYPKPAVYDREGWHPMPYLDQGEFYSEFGTFDVKIRLPKNYVVGATGDLVNGEKEINWLNQLAEETNKITDFTSTDMSFPPSNDTVKTLHFHQENVHDFAWFADKRYHVLKGEVTLPHSKRKVTTWAMFTNNEANLWKKSIDYINDATYYYSLWNGDYPYNQVIAVDGSISAGGGMEYPNITVIGESKSDFGLETVIMHEVGHNWFYGILGSNERAHPWMDEGINSFDENRYIETKFPNAKLISSDSTSTRKFLKFFDLDQYSHKTQYEIAYQINARNNLDQPIEGKAEEFTSLNYGGIVYAKTAIIFDYLMAYLGEATFDKCMQRYFNEWQFKHPQPNDLRKIFEDETQKNLSWFFNGLIKSSDKIDFKITGAKKDTSSVDSILLKIKNKGGINGPFSISGLKNDSIIYTQWYEPIGKKGLLKFKLDDYDVYKIDANLDIPEISRKNNTLKTGGLFKTIEPLRIQLFGSIENPDKTQLFFTPIAGYNSNDNAMLGLAFYNSIIPSKKFEYVLTPMYAFGSKNINGYANIFYHITPNDIFQDLAIGTKSSSFSYLNFEKPTSSATQSLQYYKVSPQVNIDFKKRRARQFKQYFLNYEFANIFEEVADFKRNPEGKVYYNLHFEKYYVNNLTVGLRSKNPINPYLVTANIQQSIEFVKVNLEANYKFAYRKKGTGFDLRFFVGRFLFNDHASSRFNYNLSGNSDYLYENILLGRNTIDNYLNQQAIISDGGFKNYTTVTSSNKWMNAINLKTNTPIKFIGLYADFGLSGFTSRNFKGDEVDQVSDATYGFGGTLILVPNICEIYFPFYLSSDLNQLKYAEKIRFTLNLNLIKPFEMVRKFDF